VWRTPECVVFLYTVAMSIPPEGNDPQRVAGAKICVDCKTDCSHRPRTKDAQGRYHCQACVDRLAQEKARAKPEASDDDGDMYDPLPLDVDPLPESAVPGGASVVAGSGAGGILAGASGIRPCPICAKPLAQSDAVCINCGYNARTGAKVATEHKSKAPKSAGKKCSKCGYLMAGVKTARCPECGTINMPPDKRERDRELAKSIARQEYRKPILMFLIGAGGVCAYLAATEPQAGTEILKYLISYLIEVPIGFAVFWICTIVWIGFDAPIHLTALRLAGIYAAVDLALVICANIPIPFAGLFIPALMYVGFLSEMLEMDLIDAIVVGFLTFMAKLGVGILLTMYVLGFI